jgi:putative ABC transport system substrate-binding protein
MDRRDTVAVLLALGAAPLASFAQPRRKVWRVGFLSGASRATAQSVVDGFPQGMRELGYVEGKNLVIEWRFAEGKYERFAELAAEMVQLKVDAIVLGTMGAFRATKKATGTIPIVMGYSTDPVGNGFVASLARPGGNVTGLASSGEDITSKHLELLLTTVPKLSRVGLLGNPDNPNYFPIKNSALVSGRKAGIDLVPLEARNSLEIESALSALAKDRFGAVIVVADAVAMSQRQRIAEFALRNRLATVFSQSEYVEAGGLMSYGENLHEFFRRAATYVDKILKGARPGELPIEQPTIFDLVINLKTAKALGLTIPQSVLLRADRVIE